MVSAVFHSPLEAAAGHVAAPVLSRSVAAVPPAAAVPVQQAPEPTPRPPRDFS